MVAENNIVFIYLTYPLRIPKTLSFQERPYGSQTSEVSSKSERSTASETTPLLKFSIAESII